MLRALVLLVTAAGFRKVRLPGNAVARPNPVSGPAGAKDEDVEWPAK